MLNELILSVMLNTTYVGATVIEAETQEEGMKICMREHVLGFEQFYDRMIEPERLMAIMKETERRKFCFGYGAAGDRRGNHRFQCFGVIWPGSPAVQIEKRCDFIFEKSFDDYAKWLAQEGLLETQTDSKVD